MLDIYTLGEDVLRKECSEVKVFDSALKMLADAMLETLEEADGVGLAGPQVGVSERIFVIHIPDNPPIVFVNPEMYCNVIRPSAVTIQAQDVTGKPFTLEATGLLARAIQHENDHLHGKLYIDLLSEKDREKAVREYERRNRRHGGRRRK